MKRNGKRKKKWNETGLRTNRLSLLRSKPKTHAKCAEAVRHGLRLTCTARSVRSVRRFCVPVGSLSIQFVVFFTIRLRLSGKSCPPCVCSLSLGSRLCVFFIPLLLLSSLFSFPFGCFIPFGLVYSSSRFNASRVQVHTRSLIVYSLFYFPLLDARTHLFVVVDAVQY